MTTLTPQTLFDYADRFARKAEAAGKGTQYPTFRQAARHFNVTMRAIQDACEDYQGSGYMSAITGLRVGSGVTSFKFLREFMVEAYD